MGEPQAKPLRQAYANIDIRPDMVWRALKRLRVG